MIDLSNFSSGAQPEILYKYISQAGILGILNSNSIWATDIFYMNDSAEYIHAVSLMKKKIKDRMSQDKSQPPQSAAAPLLPEYDPKYDKNFMELFFLSTIEEIIDKLTNFHIFVCSFTNQSDLLSQWRGYCTKGSGYSIGFKTSLLINSFHKKKYQLVKCIYEDEKKFEIIDELLQNSLDEIPQEEVNQSKLMDFLNPTIQSLIQNFFQLAPMFKDSSFYEEKEWRLVSPAIQPGSKNLKYREGTSMLIPYDEIQILTDDNLIPIEKVVIGPTQNPDLSKEAIKGLLKTNGIEKPSILLSRTPYRGW